MTDQEDKLKLDKIVFDDNNQERKTWTCLGHSCSRSLIVCLSQFFVILLNICSCFWRIDLSETCDVQKLFVWEFCVVQQDRLYPHPDFEQVNFYKKSRLHDIGRYVPDGKVTIYLQLAQQRKLSTKIWENYFYYQHSHPLYDVMEKRSKISRLFNM